MKLFIVASFLFVVALSAPVDNTKDQLIADANKLKALAASELTKLRAAGKTVLAQELEVLDKAVVDLEKRVETQHPTTDVGKIALQAEETVLKGLESKLQDLIKKASAGTFYEDTKETLIKDASALKNLAGAEIAKLQAAGKGLLAQELQVLEKAVEDLETRVEAQHPTTEIGKIALSAEETVLKGLENKLKDFITKLSSGSYYADTKDSLLKDAGLLKDLAGGEITKLLAEGKTLLAHELQVLEKAVVDLEKRVESQHPTTEIGKIALSAEEAVLKGLETKLHDFITKQTGGTYYEDTKETLIKDASALKNLASGEIAKLQAAGKTLLAQELQVLENAVISLEKRVESQNPTTEIGKIALHAEETVLKGLETKLEEFVKKLSTGSYYADTKESLLKDAGLLKELAGGEITKLLGEGKTLLAHELQVLEKAVVDLEKRVESQHPTTEIGKIALSAEEAVLKGLESKLHAFIAKQTGGTYYEDTKETLIKDASALKNLASTEIAKLQAAGKGLVAQELQVLEKAVEDLEKRVEAQHPTTEVGKIALNAEETVLKGLETKLKDFITKLSSGSYYEDTKETLIKDASALKTLASGEITKLLSEGKTLLAHELQVLEKAVVDLEARVEAQHPTTEIGKIALSAEEAVLKGLESKLHAFIAKQTGGTYYEDTKETLIKDASALKNLASGEIAKLQAAGKTLLAQELQVLEKAVEDLEKRVESQHPTTELGKIALSAEETVLKGLENKLKDFITKLGSGSA